jgi:hypothetical protein
MAGYEYPLRDLIEALGSPPYGIAMVVGIPRSGTTLLQIALSSHFDVVTARETHLFDGYLGPIIDRYYDEAGRTASADGIRNLISSDTLMSHFRSISLSVLSAIHAKSPYSRLVLEKTPGHLARMPLISACLPETKFIHIVRDPRGVTASMKAASKETWGSSWAISEARSAAELWLRNISCASEAASQLSADRYRAIRYEDLFTQGGPLINQLYDWFDLPPNPSLPDNLAERFPIGAMALTQGDRDDPRVEARHNFFRRGDPTGWRSELTSADIDAVQAVCGDMMVRFGYSPI